MKDEFKAFMSKDAFAASLGMELLEAEGGQAKARLMAEDRHLNAVGIVQGGVLFTLADLTMAAAANAHGVVAVTVNCNITFIKPGVQGWIYASAREISRNRKLGNYHVELTGPAGELLATVTGTVYFKQSAATDQALSEG